MKLEDYAAQQPQNPQKELQTQELLSAEQVAAKLDAERLSSLKVKAQEAIDDETAPAELLQMITGELFGTSSPEAAAVAAIIDAEQHPGGHEMAIADIRQRRKILKQLDRQLDDQKKAVAAELSKLDEAEREFVGTAAEAVALNEALLDVLTFCKGFDPQRDSLSEIARLCDRYSGQPAAMGLLYGGIIELTRKLYFTGGLDFVQQEELQKLKARVESALSQY